jgi:hypothetical protein
MKSSIERAASAVIGYRETGDPPDRVRYSDDFLQHAVALRDLGLSVDEAVDRIANEATSMLTRVDDEGFVRRPERRELETLIKELLTPLTSAQDRPSYSDRPTSLRASRRASGAVRPPLTGGGAMSSSAAEIPREKVVSAAEHGSHLRPGVLSLAGRGRRWSGHERHSSRRPFADPVGANHHRHRQIRADPATCGQ